MLFLPKCFGSSSLDDFIEYQVTYLLTKIEYESKQTVEL